ncbi:hypothetical protein [Methylomonas koyamae]|uniref:hypothetical protein n=1 Tax=Methylomonas koyamae TaxID=702114 RepID=UPI002872B730|nr:hypothetical protein [Methylomonas koyamae]WNB76775.1 hypothetical protein RI210_04175 [Methylomonas koyamae]
MNQQQIEAVQAAIIYSTVNQFCDKYPAFTRGGVRALVFNENSNGLAASGAIVRIGRKVLINEDKFFGWVELQNQQGGAK